MFPPDRAMIYRFLMTAMNRMGIVDLEATWWRGQKSSVQEMEIIEVGTAMIGPAGKIEDEFHAYVRPVQNRILSDFCTELTGVRHDQVDAAETWPSVFESFLQWMGEARQWGSWGNYDLQQIQSECQRHKLAISDRLVHEHTNLKRGLQSEERR
jgi:inhibitor of KinA sporulation pathway (predicted exonuclease)